MEHFQLGAALPDAAEQGADRVLVPVAVREEAGLLAESEVPDAGCVELGSLGDVAAVVLRVLDLPRAVDLRGWPQHVDLYLPLDIETEDGTKTERYTLRIANGRGELTPGGSTPYLVLTRRQFAVWYAGGYRSAASAELAGLCGEPAAITGLLMATADREPWLGEYF
ncbi:sterol carrier protein domain-containing protein (plasmid) [Streptomyces sp. NBC_01724]|uniref:sterol carrier protein domain-containing protein n=1 Tax=Streptomyces sp. NBC_01724 TaxID=2975922 RepID=UPI002E2EAAE1|nr:sterol carrier protein domain-containing protein [Streptomyces sp. NBC_01724]